MNVNRNIETNSSPYECVCVCCVRSHVTWRIAVSGDSGCAHGSPILAKVDVCVCVRVSMSVPAKYFYANIILTNMQASDIQIWHTPVRTGRYSRIAYTENASMAKSLCQQHSTQTKCYTRTDDAVEFLYTYFISQKSPEAHTFAPRVYWRSSFDFLFEIHFFFCIGFFSIQVVAVKFGELRSSHNIIHCVYFCAYSLIGFVVVFFFVITRNT